MKYLKISIAVFYIVFSSVAFSQGCNDAGICTFGDFGSVSNDKSMKIKTEASYVFGLGEKENLINTLQLDQRFSLFKGKGGVFFRLPFTYVYGLIGQTAGIGDVSVGLDYSVYRRNRINVSVTAGAKLPPNNANKTLDGKGLPMAYQTSLGTYDLIVGAGLNIDQWRIAVAYQKPFGSNGNTFLHEYWEGDEDALKYFESNELKRGDDVMLRLDREFNLKNGNGLHAGLLSVYRLQKDQIVKDGEAVHLEDSDGITLNASVGYNIRMQNLNILRILLAAPVITRKHRADGLTRTFVISVTYAIGR